MISFARKPDWPIRTTKEINNVCREVDKKPHLEELIKVGELLTKQKERLGNTKWAQWVQEALPFSRPTAQRYMLLYRAFVMGQKAGQGF